jgi:hypothetical protein
VMGFPIGLGAALVSATIAYALDPDFWVTIGVVLGLIAWIRTGLQAKGWFAEVPGSTGQRTALFRAPALLRIGLGLGIGLAGSCFCSSPTSCCPIGGILQWPFTCVVSLAAPRSSCPHGSGRWSTPPRSCPPPAPHQHGGPTGTSPSLAHSRPHAPSVPRLSSSASDSASGSTAEMPEM